MNRSKDKCLLVLQRIVNGFSWTVVNLKYIDVPFFYGYKDSKHPDHAIGVYVNYLEVGNLIVLPVFEVEGNKDEEAIAVFKQIFPDKIIETINYNDVALEGGVLNCTTWVYRKMS